MSQLSMMRTLNKISRYIISLLSLHILSSIVDLIILIVVCPCSLSLTWPHSSFSIHVLPITIVMGCSTRLVRFCSLSQYYCRISPRKGRTQNRFLQFDKHNFLIRDFLNFTNLLPVTSHLLRNFFSIFHHLKKCKRIHQIDLKIQTSYSY